MSQYVSHNTSGIPPVMISAQFVEKKEMLGIKQIFLESSDVFRFFLLISMPRTIVWLHHLVSKETSG